MLEVGVRVVRGPDWKWGNQDNGEGHVGTVVEVGRPGSTSSPDKTVVVQWDMGSRTNYRVGYQEAYDLRLFDNGPAGVRHPNVICDGCKDHGIFGMLWKCVRCFDFDLCTVCYMNDTHDLSHPFRRYDSPSTHGMDLPPRLDSPKIVSRGIFAGARVIRGPDWDWGNQDGDGKVGRVVDIRGWDHESGRSVANVIWSSGSTNVYRLGHKGKVDLKCVQASSAGSYYVDHLPVLGMPGSTINRSSASTAAKSISSKSQSSYNFSVGDKVQVVQDLAKLKEMQDGHGGWNPRMADFIGKVGTVHRVTDKGDIRVQYESGIRWTFNPASVIKNTTYCIGDVVQVINDFSKVRDLQKGHGEWVDVMKEILGKTGTIVKVYADNDLRINFGASVWTMNPLAVRLVPCDRFNSDNSMYANANRREDSLSQDPMSSMLSHFLDDMSADTSYTVERFIKEAAQGRVETVKKMLPKMKDRLNHKSSGKTPLQVAAHQGHIEIVVLLIAAGVNLEVSDDDGDTALHYSAFGNQPLVMDLILKAGALVNAVNKGQCTPLHVAVNKNYLECVKTLLKFKCNVNIQDSYGDTALHDAIGKDHRDIIDCLISTPGVDFTLKNNRGFNVLHHAALKGNHYAIDRIIGKARQLVDVKKDDGFAALHLSALNGHFTVTRALLEQGQAEIDVRNNRKQTPLLLAVSQGYCGIVELLVAKGAAISPEDEDGDTPLHTILIKHFNGHSSQDQSNHAHIPNPMISMELRKHENAPVIAEIVVSLTARGWTGNENEMGAAALACFMAQAGADLSKRNRRGVIPLDLVSSDRLKDALVHYSQNRRRSVRLEEGSPGRGVASPNTTLTSPRPAGKTGECLLCSEVMDLILFEPCGHQIVCDECCVRMKKCLNCHQPILRKVSCQGSVISSNCGRTASINPSAERLRYLENKFAEIEETYCCSICMERRRNIAFLCGHGACERCADALSTCHMCRTPITQKINLY
ncbi:unnamed protein product [Orchesella dallaii]|uniref:RING-type E3 ubiquitin transferase n=1 Tax=Orchesella dallaii TaxID=48710 RepID=A0ABP1QA84_9HEXA